MDPQAFVRKHYRSMKVCRPIAHYKEIEATDAQLTVARLTILDRKMICVDVGKSTCRDLTTSSALFPPCRIHGVYNFGVLKQIEET
jgi:hypothetical protein